MEEVDPRARFWTARVDSEEADLGEVGHPLATSWCLIPDFFRSLLPSAF